MNFLSKSLTARITKQVKDQLPQILPDVVSNFAPPVIQKMVTESLKEAVLANESSQPQFSYEAAKTLIEFELKKILIDKMDKNQSYLTASKHKEYKYKDPSARSDRGLKKRKTSKDAELTKEPTDPDWNVDKTLQQGQNQSWLMTLASSAEKPSNTIDELLSTPIDFSTFIMNGLKINNLTQETLLGPAFRLLKGTRSNYAELKYDFEECYKALSEKLGDDVSDFAIALRMFTRSLVIQKRVEDFQLRYLPKRRWSTLEKKRANIMIKAIGKQLKERRLMRSLEKFLGGKDYGTDLRLLQQTI
ncbi:hypothetical protein Tco_1112612 [Tanacetum coccineum]|uniref:Uncharacterized protein n=1 Tax=Tanacetum coccineum TaxID=301880 RepID=A0ABQ5IQ28_9ASTR